MAATFTSSAPPSLELCGKNAARRLLATLPQALHMLGITAGLGKLREIPGLDQATCHVAIAASEVVRKLETHQWGSGTASVDDVKTLKKARELLESAIRGVILEDHEEEKRFAAALRSKEDNAEWEFIDDGEVEGREAKKEKKEKKVRSNLGRSALILHIKNVCESLTTLLYLLSSVPEAGAVEQDFAAPIKITTFLGTSFLFPAEYSFAELEAILKIRLAEGPGARYIQNGQWELINATSRWIVVDSHGGLKPGTHLILTAVVNGPIAEDDNCPIPTCKSTETRGIYEDGRVCNKCGVWFYRSHVERRITREGASTSSDEPKGKYVKKNTENLNGVPYKEDREQINAVGQDLAAFKYIKIYPSTERTLAARESEKTTCYSCKKCSTQIAMHDEITSRNFRGVHGKAYLFENAYNITRGPTTERQMTTGKHDICEVFCQKCSTCIGWAYEGAEISSEFYKIGKFLLETELLVGNGKEDRRGSVFDRGVTAVRKTEAAEKRLQLLTRVTTPNGNLVDLEDLEKRLRALMDEENGIEQDEEED